MFTIGDFAQLGLVSVRMLRHYDAIGLLRPAHVDPATGYRFYEATQLARLNRLVALKDLGLTLDQVGVVLDDKIGLSELQGMLLLRRLELQQELQASADRLRRVEARLRAIEREGAVPDVIVKQLGAVRIACLSAVADSYESADISPVIQPLYPDICARLERAGVPIVGPGVAYYEPVEGDRVRVYAGMQVNVSPSSSYDFSVMDLPPVSEAATMIHRGAMAHIGSSYQSLATWIEDNGYRQNGFAREVYLSCPDNEDDWVTELQVALVHSGSSQTK
ncbi:MerR family transcriptional regulator [Lentzea sp. NBRC 105346]|uniref:MerR family transcriptional regulator n=1 Tax=Lentzea sp. NBRC 105346 TaxID=3032205 RepID=UPI0024A32E76|nr:MerR family transcriptional regulator [Lentzea sp. NBRC 105346]GLZ33399.1 MerR family transcriptional regulator [Lentzea sp. NBRC 105346]